MGGTREVERDQDGRPTTIEVDGIDAVGRTFYATGRAVARQVFTAYPSMFCYNSLVRWDGDGGGWGEDQDCWHPRRWKRFLAELRVDGGNVGPRSPR